MNRAIFEKLEVLFMAESQNIEYKESWRDEYLKCQRAIVPRQMALWMTLWH